MREHNDKRGIRQKGGLALLVAFLCVSAGCVRHAIRLKLDGNNPPTFTLANNSLHVSVGVSEIAPANQNLPPSQHTQAPNKYIWGLRFNEEQSFFDRLSTSTLTKFTYGQVPLGYIQVMPAQGAAPVLEEGKVYEAIVIPPAGGNPGTLWFKLEKGATIEVRIPKSSDKP